MVLVSHLNNIHSLLPPYGEGQKATAPTIIGFRNKRRGSFRIPMQILARFGFVILYACLAAAIVTVSSIQFLVSFSLFLLIPQVWCECDQPQLSIHVSGYFNSMLFFSSHFPAIEKKAHTTHQQITNTHPFPFSTIITVPSPHSTV